MAWERLQRPHDLLVIGGGITGAAVLWEAARRGLRAALVERNDFASGTSSRSSKLVHGGLRYLKEGKIGMTRESVREREELLRDAPGLVDAMPFLLPHYRGRAPGRATLAAGLALYDVLAGSWRHRYVDRDEALALVPPLDPAALTGAHVYLDATTDDARLVLRLIQAACAAGATAINYAGAALLLDGAGLVRGARIVDAAGGAQIELLAKATVAATGVFADELRAELGAAPRLRPLRGSHLVLPDWRLPLAGSVAFEHPRDGRPVFAYPWLGCTLVGTTDLDHRAALDEEPSIEPQEVAYLIEGLRYQFPALQLEAGDAVAAYAGVRPIVDGGTRAPSQASRDHAVWKERGLVTITGGKLTTFRPMAMDALAAAAGALPPFDLAPHPVFRPEPPPTEPRLAHAARRRLAGRYGKLAQRLIEAALPGELESIGGTSITWAELRWGARREAVVRLDDLLLRRTRLGLLTAGGGERYFDRIGAICREELQWDRARWDAELAAYRTRWRARYRAS